MPRERDAPYVAAGFRADAEKLLKKFVAKKTLSFPEFASVWREMSFYKIFMGREALRELHEFMEECYRNTLLFMDTSNIFQKVGAVYLLYSLYLKQPLRLLGTPVAIAVTLKVVLELQHLEVHFLDGGIIEGVMDLSYIINRLFKIEAFSISYVTIPMGPLVPIPLLRLEPLRYSCFKEILGMLSMLNDKEVKNVVTLSKQYDELKKKIPSMCSNAKTAGGVSKLENLKKVLDELEYRYNGGLLPTNKVDGDVKIEEEFRSLGMRRAMLKNQQYERETDVGLFRRIRDSSDSSPTKSVSSSPVKRSRGRPRRSRRRRRRRVSDAVSTVQVKKEPVVENDAEDVDDPDDPLAVVKTSGLFPRRPRRYPRPVRKHYYEDE